MVHINAKDSLETCHVSERDYQFFYSRERVYLFGVVREEGHPESRELSPPSRLGCGVQDIVAIEKYFRAGFEQTYDTDVILMEHFGQLPTTVGLFPWKRTAIEKAYVEVVHRRGSWRALGKRGKAELG